MSRFMRLALIGVPANSAGLPTGEARAPAVLRAAGLLDLLSAQHDVADYGDFPGFSPTPARDPQSGIIDPDTLVQIIVSVREQVSRAFNEERVPLVIGGDCPLLIGCLAAMRDAFGSPGLLFVDGHEDAWPPHRSTTGEAADMELGLALGLTTAPELPELDRLLPVLAPDDAVLLGPRDHAEIAEAGIPSIASEVTVLDDQALLVADIRGTTRDSVRRLHDGAGRWWFHLDLDVLSTTAMPAVRYQQPGGLSWDDVETISRETLTAPGLAGWDITIYNPDLDPKWESARKIVQVIDEVLAPNGEREDAAQSSVAQPAKPRTR